MNDPQRRPKLVSRLEDLQVCVRVRRVARELFVVSQTWPREERYSLTDQIRRSSRSIGAQIAEAWGKRRFARSFVAKLADAKGEQIETIHWIGTAVDCHYLASDRAAELQTELEAIGRQLDMMISKAGSFSRSV